MKKNSCYLLYDYNLDLPAGVFDTLEELSKFLGRGKASVLSQISRIKNGKIKFTCDNLTHKYLIYKVELEEE